MKIIKYIIFPLLLFICSCILAFLFEDAYRKLIYNLYIYLSNERISFKTQKLDLNFANALFIYSFAIFTIILYFLVEKQNFKQLLKKTGICLLGVIVSTIVMAYLDVLLKLAQCTACANDNRVLNPYEVKTDFIFSFSLLCGLIPFIFLAFKKYRPLTLV